MTMDLQKQFYNALPLVQQREWLAQNCSNGGRLAAFATEVEQAVLQLHLSTKTLPDALAGLQDHQLFRGFVRDTLAQLRRTRIKANGGDGFFLAHCNPARANRMDGAGLKSPPRGVDLSACPSSTCFLCEGNQKWQQRGLQFGYSIKLDSRDYVCSCNPFPFGQLHTTIAAASHNVAQRWVDEEDLLHVTRSIVDLATGLPGWVVLYNGSRSAGASIPDHRHYQVFKLDGEQMPLPLQQAADAKAERIGQLPVVPIVGGVDYPVTCFSLTSDLDAMVRNTVDLGIRWRSTNKAYSENIIAINGSGRVSLFYVPRDEYSHAARFSGAIACLEILGEFIFSSAQDIRALGEGEVDYEWLSNVLRDITPPKASLLIGAKDAMSA